MMSNTFYSVVGIASLGFAFIAWPWDVIITVAVTFLIWRIIFHRKVHRVHRLKAGDKVVIRAPRERLRKILAICITIGSYVVEEIDTDLVGDPSADRVYLYWIYGDRMMCLTCDGWRDSNETPREWRYPVAARDLKLV